MSFRDDLKNAFAMPKRENYKKDKDINSKDSINLQNHNTSNIILNKAKEKVSDFSNNMYVSKKKYELLELQLKQLKEKSEQLGLLDALELSEKIDEYKVELNTTKEAIEKAKKELTTLNEQIYEKTKISSALDDDIYFTEFGLYKPQYICMNSEEYKERINFVRSKQKDRIKNKKALSYYDSWVLDGSTSKGRALNNDNMKMVLRAFNNECDVLISKVKFNNVDIIEERIKKAATAIDKLNIRNKISILPEFIDLKIQELHLVHEYHVKKQEEKEELRRQREEEREEKKLQEELRKAREDANKEYKHYLSAKEKLINQLEQAENKEYIKARLLEMDTKLDEIEKGIKELDYREANKRAGYVYVISNIGSFGENIYKIGMTRRLDPMDRIDELGDASVPFKFDVHAMIFSDDAPALETALHNKFSNYKVNMINGRKEFFNVTLEEIEKVIKENHEKLVEIKKTPDAEQYRESLLIKKIK